MLRQFYKAYSFQNFYNKYIVCSALKESGYESDSQLFFRKRNDGGIQTPTSDNKEARYLYKEIQKGGEVPLCGLRKSLPEKHGESLLTLMNLKIQFDSLEYEQK